MLYIAQKDPFVKDHIFGMNLTKGYNIDDNSMNGFSLIKILIVRRKINI